MSKKRFYLTPVIAKDIYGMLLTDEKGEFVISHWTYEHQRFFPGKAEDGTIAYLEDSDGARYTLVDESESKVYSMKKGNVIYELVIP